MELSLYICGMEVNDLRINNYVTNQVGNIIRVNVDVLNSINYKRGIYNPIQLTEEWLVNLGLRKISNLHFKFPSCYMNNLFLLFAFGKIEYIYKINGGHVCIAECNYVHELQNLYKSTSKKELNLTT